MSRPTTISTLNLVSVVETLQAGARYTCPHINGILPWQRQGALLGPVVPTRVRTVLPQLHRGMVIGATPLVTTPILHLACRSFKPDCVDATAAGRHKGRPTTWDA